MCPKMTFKNNVIHVADYPQRPAAIRSPDGLVVWMDRLNHLTAELIALQQQATADKNAIDAFLKSATIEISEGHTVSAATYYSAIVREVEAYSTVMEGDTYEGPSGRVARRKSADSLIFTPRIGDESDDKPTEKTGEALSKSLAWNLIKSGVSKLLKTAGLDRFWKLEIKPDITTAKAAFSRGEVTTEELAAQGLEIVPGTSRTDLKVNAGKPADIIAALK
jgi:hypothetical protein